MQKLHAERHAVMDAVRRRGRELAFASFRSATAWVVELDAADAVYDAAAAELKPQLLALEQSFGSSVHRVETPPGSQASCIPNAASSTAESKKISSRAHSGQPL